MAKRSFRSICIILVLFTVFGAFTVCAGEEERRTEITSVRFSEDGSTLLVSATLSDAMLDMYSNRPVYLFEFYPCDKNADLAAKTPVAYKMAAEELTFELDMTEADPQRKYSKFILATQKGTDYSLMGNVVYVENPEALASGEARPHTPANAVGISAGGEEVSDKFAHTVLPVNVNEMFADTADGSNRYEYGENVYYIDTEMLARLDSRVKSLSESGAAVYMQLLLSAPDESTANLAMSLYCAEEGGEYYAPNTANPLGVRLWSALVEFLCERYCVQSEYGSVNAFILGNNVNEMINYAGGGDTAEDFAAGLLRTLRVTETALRSTCRGTGLYVSLGGEYSGSFSDAFPVRDLLPSLCIPELSFGIYMDVSTESPDFWCEEGIESHSATPRITPKNIDLLLETMQDDAMLYDGDMRALMLSYSADGTDRHMQAASALCALYRAVTLQGVRAVIYNTYSDTEGSARGLFAQDGMPKLIYGELCTAAEGDLVTVSDQIRALLGQSEYESLHDSVLSELFVVRSALPIYTGNIPREVDAAYIADFVDGNLYDFVPGITTLTHGFTMDSTGNVLRLSGKKDTAGMTRTFESYDLTEKNILIVELKALADDPTASFNIILDGKKGAEEVSLTATVSLTSGEWNELAFDISGMDTLSEMTLTVTSDEGGALTWYIKDITVFATGGGGVLAVKIAVAVLVIALILFIILLVTLIYMRSRKRPAPRDRYTVSRRTHTVREKPVIKPEPPKSEPVIPVMPKTEPKTFVVPPKHTEPVKRATMSLGIEPISADTDIDIDKTKG